MQLTITALLHPAMDHATRESKFVNNLIDPRQQHENDFAYILRKQKLFKINIWLYVPCSEGKVKMFNSVDGVDKDRKDVRILVWGNGLTERCALIKTLETLIETPNKSQHKF